MERTMRLLVRRFQVSQHPQAGSWDYHFVLGGSDKESPQMTAVGLLGLAVGHGLAAPNRGAPVRGPVRNAAILKGFTALNRWVGTAQGKWEGPLEQQNLYYLWSLERVAVLYNLELIGGKDWYRWGAEILVANQTPAGHWENGKYYGSSHVLDTCFALLFLQRVNLVKDLSAKLPFNPTELNTAVAEEAKKEADRKAPPRDDTATKPSPVEPTPPQPSSIGLTESKDPAGESQETNAVSQPTTPTENRRDATPSTEPEEKRKTWRNVLLGAFAVLMLGFGIFLAVYLTRGRKEEPVARKPRPKKTLAKKSANG
jgi:hypothetical protein